MKHTISFRVTQEEYQRIEEAAIKAEVTISEYTRFRLLEDAIGRIDVKQDYNKEVMRLLVHSFLLLKPLCKKLLDDSEYKASKAKAEAILKQWGYKNE